MDRRVKERLVGASILVILMVLIVPEMLSGPAPSRAPPKLPVSTQEPIRNVTVDLATSKSPAPESVVPPSAAPLRSDGETQGTLAGAASSQGGASSAAAPPPAADSSVPLETTAPSPTSVASAGKSAPGGHAWSVQLGSFASHPNAEKLLRQLKAQGFSAYVLSGGSGSSLRYRVRIGPMADRGAAAQTVAKLKTFGHAASVVPPGG